jgi:hypothetical protein
MLIVIDRIRKQDSDFFKNDTWQVCYFNTGWARDGWDIRVKLIKDMCEKYELNLRFPPAVPPRRPPSSLLIPTHWREFLRVSLFAFSHQYRYVNSN